MDSIKFIQDLNALTTKWVKGHKLFKGGCAYAAAVLARELSKAGIKYEIVSFDPEKFDPIAGNRSSKHIGVAVPIGRKKLYIGGEPTLREKTYKTRLGQISPEVLMAYYERLKKDDKWNPEYNSRKNFIFSWMCHLVRLQQESGWCKIFKYITQ